MVSIFALINPKIGSGPTLPSDAIAKGVLPWDGESFYWYLRGNYFGDQFFQW